MSSCGPHLLAEARTSVIFPGEAAVTVLRDSGLDEAPAIAIVNTMRDALTVSMAQVATKSDLENAIAGLRADLFRALWIQGAGLVAIQIAIAGFIITAVRFL